jgi:hypothetical protein
MVRFGWLHHGRQESTMRNGQVNGVAVTQAHSELVERHLALVGDQRREERRASERRVEPGGMGAVPGIDRRRRDRRKDARRD